VMRLVLVGADDDLAVDGVLDASFDAYHHRLVHLVADHFADQGALALGRLRGLGFGHFTFLPSRSAGYAHARCRGGPCATDWCWSVAAWHAAYASRIGLSTGFRALGRARRRLWYEVRWLS